MQVFIRVAELSSFTKAALDLGLPKASVSVYVQELEALLGTRLLQRTTRTVKLTSDGQIFLERARHLLYDMDEIETLFVAGNDKSLKGVVRVDMSIGIARNVVIPELHHFIARYPEIKIELSCTDRRVDVIQEGFDCVLRVGELRDSELMMRSLPEYEIINCVSPSYIKNWGKPRKLSDLSRHQLIHYVSNFGQKSQGFEYHDGKELKFYEMPGAITVNNSEAYVEACLNGLGLIQAPKKGLQTLINQGKLLEVLPKLKAEAMPVSLIYPHRRHIPKRVKIFMDWIVEIF